MSDHARIEALERQLLSLQQSLETVKGEREQWRPIETAPKDGTRVLVFIGHSFRPLIGHWDDNCDDWSDEDDFAPDPQPTHWMPLPDPPTFELEPIDDPALWAPEPHEPLCSVGVKACDGTLPCDCALSRLSESATPQSAGATKVEGSQEADAQNLPSALLRERPQEPTKDILARTGETSTATNGVATASTDTKG